MSVKYIEDPTPQPTSDVGLSEQDLIEIKSLTDRLRVKGILTATVFSREEDIKKYIKVQVYHEPVPPGGIPMSNAAHYNFGTEDTLAQVAAKVFMHTVAIQRLQTDQMADPHFHEETEEHIKQYHPDVWEKMQRSRGPKATTRISEDELKKMDPENEFKN